MASSCAVPATRVTSPSPSPSDTSETYSGPRTRSVARRERLAAAKAIAEEDGGSRSENTEDGKPDNQERANSRRSTGVSTRTPRRRSSKPTTASSSKSPAVKSEPLTNGFLSPNGHVSPKGTSRNVSRSPSPLGLIPLHQSYRTFIHKHEIPRKALHVSIGFLTLDLYRRGVQTTAITPLLISALVPISAIDVVRHRSERLNRAYVRVVGALMRETEVTSYNGVIWYLLGAYIVLRFFPKDIGVMGVLLLSWCDTAASTFGRLYGRYTPRLRRGKSLAGTLAAWVTGVITAALFWGVIVPRVGSFPDDPPDAFMFQGRLNLFPDGLRRLLGYASDSTATAATTISGGLALGVMSVVSGIVAAGSELIDLFGWDDNLTIPVLSGIGLWGFLKIFG
ncbi:hypothetical protein VTN49DRAFT_6711 [Thermomyces lanuginosus]|uniref:uncharacterized protein n=1 Tax=Thermomyces lanuginosus TaxID=5541 RepID=UPI003743C162